MSEIIKDPTAGIMKTIEYIYSRYGAEAKDNKYSKQAAPKKANPSKAKKSGTKKKK